MKLYFFTEARFESYNGKFYSDSAFSNSLWSRYLQKFPHINVVARVKAVTSSSRNLVELDQNRVTIKPLSNFKGPIEFLKKRNTIKREIEALINTNNVYICRVPGNIGHMAIKILNRKKIPYGVEVVGNPEDALSSKALGGNKLSFIYRWSGIRNLSYDVINSHAAFYVTQQLLQNKYPVRDGIFSVGASDVILYDDFYSKESKKFTSSKKNIFRLLSVGSLEQMYKAPDIVLQALAKIKSNGYKFHFIWCGGGKYLEDMKTLSKNLGLEEDVDFFGNVDITDVRKYMNDSDLFIHASRAEGLPRAVIEAMAYALPCIGSKVGGIPELLDEIALVKPGDTVDLANKLETFINSPNLLSQQSERNFNESKKFHNSILNERRLKFFDEIIRISSQS